MIRQLVSDERLAASLYTYITQKRRKKPDGEWKDTRPNQTKEHGTRAVLKIKRAFQVYINEPESISCS